MGTVYVIIGAVFWGIIGIFVRRLQDGTGIGSWETGELRMLVSVIFLGGFLLLGHRDKLRIRLKDLWVFLGTGLCSTMVFSWCYYETIQRTSLAVAGILLYTAPMFVMLMSRVFFRELLTRRKLLALALAFGGCVLACGAARGQLALTPVGLLVGLGSGFFYALYSIFSRVAINRGYHSWTIAFYTFVFCALGYAFMADWGVIGTAVTAQPTLIFYILGLGFFTGFLAFVFYTMGLATMESSRASILASLEPVVAAVVGVVVFHEKLGWDTLLGIALVLCAIVLLSLKERRNVNNP